MILSIVFLCITLIAFVLVILFVKPNKKNKHGMHTTKQTRSSQVEQYNIYVSQMNKLNSSITTVVNNMVRLATLYNNKEAIRSIGELVEEINKRNDYIDDYFKRAGDCLSAHDTTGCNYCLSAIKADMDVLEELYHKVQDISITKQEEKQINKPKSETPLSYHFFNGCKNKEDADIRYRNLSKALHPDAKGGDTTLFQEMQNEYERFLKGVIYE